LLKLLYRSDTFTRLMDVIFDSFPQAVATIVLNAIVIFIFAALTTNMFNVIKEGAVIDDLNNFRNFVTSMISVFKLSTGASWGDVIVDSAISAPGCTPLLWRPVDLNSTAADTGLVRERDRNFVGLGVWNQGDLGTAIVIPSDCGEYRAAYPLFLIFILLNNYILLPTFLASIIASYFQANLRDRSLVSDADLKKYQESWVDLNPDGNALTGKSYFTFKQSTKAPKAERA
jgi:hypothetical protein